MPHEMSASALQIPPLSFSMLNWYFLLPLGFILSWRIAYTKSGKEVMWVSFFSFHSSCSSNVSLFVLYVGLFVKFWGFVAHFCYFSLKVKIRSFGLCHYSSCLSFMYTTLSFFFWYMQCFYFVCSYCFPIFFLQLN